MRREVYIIDQQGIVFKTYYSWRPLCAFNEFAYQWRPGLESFRIWRKMMRSRRSAKAQNHLVLTLKALSTSTPQAKHIVQKSLIITHCNRSELVCLFLKNKYLNFPAKINNLKFFYYFINILCRENWTEAFLVIFKHCVSGSIKLKYGIGLLHK